MVTHTASTFYSPTLTGALFGDAKRVSKLVQVRFVVNGNNFEANTEYEVGTLTKIKPLMTLRFSLGGDGTVQVGSTEISTTGKVIIRVSSKTAYYSANITYFTEDI